MGTGLDISGKPQVTGSGVPHSPMASWHQLLCIDQTSCLLENETISVCENVEQEGQGLRGRKRESDRDRETKRENVCVYIHVDMTRKVGKDKYMKTCQDKYLRKLKKIK